MGKYSLLIVSALIFSMIAYSYAMRNAIFISNIRTVQSYSQNQAHNIAQSALMASIKDINEGGGNIDIPGPGETSETGFQQWNTLHGEYNIRVFNDDVNNILRVQSTGRFEETIYTANVGLIEGTGEFVWPILDVAVHADESISFGGSGSIQGNASINGIASNSVNFGGNPSITGVLSIGPGGEPDQVVNYPDWHSGPAGGISVLPQEKKFDMPSYPEFPSLPPGAPLRTVQWNDPVEYYANQFNGQYIPELTIDQNRSMTLHVGDQNRKLYVGNLNIVNGHLNIVGSGNIEIHVLNNMVMGSGSSVNCNAQYWTDANNCSGTAEQVTTFYGGSSAVNFSNGTFFNGNMFIQDADLTLGGGNGFFGNIISGGSNVDITGGADAVSRVIYAPEADVRLTGGGTLTGSIISKTYYSDGGTWVKYDADLDTELPELEGEGNSSKYNFAYWN